MATFQYRALRPDGTMAEGVLEAGGRQEAMRQVDGLDLNLVSLSDKQESRGRLKRPGRRARTPFHALESFTRQLSNLLAAGVPLSRSLKLLSGESAHPAAAVRWREVHDRVVDGAGLADAMEQAPDVFPRVYVAMVRAGETGGFLDHVLERIADFQHAEKELRSRVVTALIYPAVLMTLAISVLVFLLTFFIPRFQLIFVDFGGELPLLTRMIVGASDFFSRYGIFMALLVLGACIGLHKWFQTEAGRRRWSEFVVRMPVFGPLHVRFALTRFCRMLGTLAAAGVPLIASLRVARESIGNQMLSDAVSECIDRVRKGEGLAASLSLCPRLFPPSIIEIISVAEESGKLDRELLRVAETTGSDLERRLQMAVALAEPLLLLLMAAFIGTIFIGMALPIFTIQAFIK